MDFLQTIVNRKSTRSYQQTQVPNEILEEIIQIGCAAPVALKKYDSLHITVIQNKSILENISNEIKQIRNQKHDPLYGAPTVLLLSSKEMPAPGLDYANCGFVMENMTLAATNQAIGSVVIWGVGLAISKNQFLRENIELSKDFKPIVGLAVGYPNNTVTDQKQLDRTITTNFIK